ncbi:L-fuculose-phosphate aldolase [Novimethylophilus kurashikiensis]|uniref:L-fuculose-phosphate aldolase n=1 Tax=Novimethylophilus kurashikiensis TaxID=1825523 RepID=A0A2R5FFJ7_9PROT|nr:class II aldolase/adducin family protein [Novimethylophilus kurashikiensis]GBG15141.1 L-fuculose-phosphate aldolase [Novimethylophilus kurashikiensis]
MITAICDVLKTCYDRGWVSTRDGNGSVRRKHENWIYITPSGAKKHRLDAENLIKLEFQADGSLVKVPQEATGKPSGELELHRRLLREIPDTRTVVHAHPTYTIAAMYAGFDLQALSEEFPEIHRYTRVAANVPNVPAISRELAEATCEALELQADGSISADIVGLDRHGVIAVARDPWGAFEHVERLEHVCQIVLASGKRPHEIGSIDEDK